MEGTAHDQNVKTEADWRPRLRPVEASPHSDEDQQPMVVVHDPTGIADAALTMSLPALQILSLMDGRHTRQEIQRDFALQFGQILTAETLDELLQNLEETHFLDGPSFEKHYDKLVKEYRGAPTRRMNQVEGLGLDQEDVAAGLSQLFPWEKDGQAGATIAGLIAPHLDYGRGQPCYMQAYSALLAQSKPCRRYVILGTNHFGLASSVVATSKDFETPLGITPTDVAFLERLEERCDSLRRHELDHRREHAIELQVLLLQDIFGPEAFSIVPILCPNPCGPTGTAPLDGEGIDLRDFAQALGELVAEDDTATCIIAGADLSHVGGFFGDTMQLTEAFLEQVRNRDQGVLSHVANNDAEKFLDETARDGNPTRICSAGCIYTLMTALPHARARQLGYHQAVNHEMKCSVSCAAAIFVLP